MAEFWPFTPCLAGLQSQPSTAQPALLQAEGLGLLKANILGLLTPTTSRFKRGRKTAYELELPQFGNLDLKPSSRSPKDSEAPLIPRLAPLHTWPEQERKKKEV